MHEYLNSSDACEKKIDECLQEVQNQIESSFKNIDDHLDSLLCNPPDFIDINPQKCLSMQPAEQLIQMPQINFENLNFYSDFQQQVSPIIEIKIKTYVFFKEQYLNQLHSEKIMQIKQKIKQLLEQQKQDLRKQLAVRFKELEMQFQQQYQEIQMLNNIQKQQQSEQMASICQQNKQQNYQLKQEYSVQQNEQCHAIAINQDCSILVAACESKIKVFQFNQGMMKQIQILGGHKNWINTLNFMKQSEQFISGSQDYSIIIWQKNGDSQWIQQQILNGHSGSIFCLIINDQDDLIISGSSDQSIKFWKKQKEWKCQQTIKAHCNSVRGISLNEQQNRLISCGGDNLILIMQQQEDDKQWIVTQKITVEQFGNRICFINNNIFTFQPYGIEQMSVFEMNNQNNQYIQTKNIDVKCGLASGDISLYPQSYINQKGILINKNGEYINVIRNNNNAEFLLEQPIFFGTANVFGSINHNGDYLITWDNKSKQIQVRKYEEQSIIL